MILGINKWGFFVQTITLQCRNQRHRWTLASLCEAFTMQWLLSDLSNFQ